MERDCIMPYHKDKQQAFQAAQQGVTQAENAFNNIVKNDPNYGHDLKNYAKRFRKRMNKFKMH